MLLAAQISPSEHERKRYAFVQISTITGRQPLLEIRVGDVLRLKKPHPCGSQEWAVYRIGADIGIRCLGCRRPVMLQRRDLERRVRAVVRVDEAGPAPSPS